MKAGDISIKGKSLKTGEEGWIKLEDIARAIFEAIAEQNNQCPNKSEGDVKLLTKQVQTGSACRETKDVLLNHTSKSPDLISKEKEGENNVERNS
jgi:hypothetical protein